MIIAHSAMIPRRGGESGNMPSDSGNKNRLLLDSFFSSNDLDRMHVIGYSYSVLSGQRSEK
jgi:hypothetical protein